MSSSPELYSASWREDIIAAVPVDLEGQIQKNFLMMSKIFVQRPLKVDTTFGSLLRELQQIWADVGETDSEIDDMLLELEQECLEVYRRKVEKASHARARLHQSIAEKEGELASLFAALGERPALTETEKKPRSLKVQLAAITPQLEDLRLKKDERVKQFSEVKMQIQTICSEISGSAELNEAELFANINDGLSVRRLDEYRAKLQALQREKSDRLHKVLECVNALHELCAVLGLDFTRTIIDVHPSLKESGAGQQSKSISNETLQRLSDSIQSLGKERKERLQRLQTLVASLTELWSLMDTPQREKEKFRHLMDCLGKSESEISAHGGLSLDAIEQARGEVQRLEQLKASKMKELVLKKRMELEEVCRQAHMEPDASTASDKTNALIDSGMVDASELLVNMEGQIVYAREQAQSRKDILDRVEKWLAACQEECWLEDYSMDNKRYTASKGAHLNLKRAERARVTVNKLPGLVEVLVAKTRAWEEEKNAYFVFDGVRLLSMLDEYILTRQLREEGKRRLRDQKRLQEQLATEMEAFYGSKHGLSKTGSINRTASKRSSLPGTPRRRPGTPEPVTPRSNGVLHHHKPRPTAPLNFVAMHKDDNSSLLSPAGSSDTSSPFTPC